MLLLCMIYKNYTITFKEFCMKNHSKPILVIDLEATCDEGDGLPGEDMEVIEYLRATDPDAFKRLKKEARAHRKAG